MYAARKRIGDVDVNVDPPKGAVDGREQRRYLLGAANITHRHLGLPARLPDLGRRRIGARLINIGHEDVRAVLSKT